MRTVDATEKKQNEMELVAGIRLARIDGKDKITQKAVIYS